ncbi:3-ketodihydrosphingosine reductase tsc-10 [Fusarium albosuccineum]|uniref:3-dehydrosphinganine reductase n=1 Tax=Fusarium albosuccineum TaxID=1237068 RepID=A0A8H4LD92_9HYPO|nr:3-ketodihydrosphingosine reductase tsc-10 [Fusarium albosuccineum]
MDFSSMTITSVAAASIATVVFAVFIMGLFGGNKMPVEAKTILLTGASEGMGLSAATKLSAKGANIILVSRSVGKLEAALATVKAVAKNPETQRFHYISADVSAPSYAGALLAEAISWNHGKSPDIVWSVAGMSYPELFIDMEMESLRRHMDVNFYGAAELSHAILREWLAPNAPIEKEPKHLILTSSVVAFYSPPGYGPYAPAKYAMRGMAETIAQEVLMYPQNVKVHVVFPGTIVSSSFIRENEIKPEITKIIEKDDPQQTPDQVAEKAIKGLEKGEYFITVAFLSHLMKWGSFGGAWKNNFIVDFLGMLFTQFVWIFVRIDIDSKIKNYGKTHGHPSTYKRKTPKEVEHL